MQLKTGYSKIYVAMLLMAVTAISGCKDREAPANVFELETAVVAEDLSEAIEPMDEVSVFVYVVGAVHHPGVYELTTAGRIYEAIERAGGVTEDAAPEFLNQARIVHDGERIYVPTQDELASESDNFTEMLLDREDAGRVTANPDSGKVNINQAGIEELKTLTGIGEVKAQSIIRYREQQGAFQSLEDLMRVEGVKEGTFQKIKDRITL